MSAYEAYVSLVACVTAVLVLVQQWHIKRLAEAWREALDRESSALSKLNSHLGKIDTDDLADAIMAEFDRLQAERAARPPGAPLPTPPP